MKLQGENISLRALEPTDLEFLFEVENNPEFWEISQTQTPFARHTLANYIQNAHQDIYEAKQFRFVIQDEKNEAIGFIDLFEFDPKNQRVGIGIIVIETEQNKGHANDALNCLCSYCFDHLNVHQIFANITSDNIKSLALFEKFNFKRTGTKKDWIYTKGQFKDEHLYQLLKSNHEA